MYAELVEEQAVQEFDDDIPITEFRISDFGFRNEYIAQFRNPFDLNPQFCIPITDQEEEMATEEFEFTAELAVELPTYVDPKQFFSYLVRVMVAHTEAYGGFMGGETKWSKYAKRKNSHTAQPRTHPQPLSRGE